jgi:hypothetical protein
MAKAKPVLLSSAEVRARYANASVMWIKRRLNDDSGFPSPVYSPIDAIGG